MNVGPELLLIGAVAAVGVLHTIVPDHWVPITLIARQRSWSKSETARASFLAGVGHALSTLLIASVVWLAGVAVGTRFGHIVDTAASTALVVFGCWIAIAAWRELRGHGGQGHRHGHGHSHDHSHVLENRSLLTRHVHIHRHGHGVPHTHWHDHIPETVHAPSATIAAEPPLHEHQHKTSARTVLPLILGSSPMVEGIPAFFAAAKYGVSLIAAMAVVFAISTIATYVLLCVYSTAGLQRIQLGAFERYGEVLSGSIIALVGFTLWAWPVIQPFV
jgi:hypothetical protein